MRKFIAPLLLLLLVITVFHSWFFPGLLSTFDFPYFSSLMMKDAGIIPYAWGWHVGLDGFAKFISPYSWVLPLMNIPQVIFGRMGMDWPFIERITYLYPLLILLISSPIILTKYFFPKNKFYLISVLVFSFNTYSLLLAGGEIFLALAYVLIPVILVLFAHMLTICNSKENSKYKYPVIAGLLISLQIMFDPRVAYVTLSAVALYTVFSILYFVFSKKFLNEKILNTLYLILYILVPLGIAGLLHAFWIIPSFFHGGNPVEALGSAYSTIEAVKYLSFAKLENTISLLHPNWPENIFGKVYFMRPEFLLLPVLAYSSLFFISTIKNQQSKIYILFFALLGLLGAFLAKGANEPFGEIYLWLFNHVPGFIMFRDPAKWYPLVAISYAVLVPFTIWKVYELLKSQPKFQIANFKFQIKSKYQILNFQNLFVILASLYLILLVRPAIFGQLGGMFKTTNVPKDYIKLEKFLSTQEDFYRTLWIPSKQRFGNYSSNHPEMSGQILLNTTDNKKLFKKLSEKNTEKLIQESAFKYVIVPYDSEGEIFLNDRKYDENLYKKTVEEVSKIPYLKKVNQFGKIAVFEVPNHKDHFYFSNQQSAINNQKLTYQYINPVTYEVNVQGAKTGDVIVFSESYDSKWIASDKTSNLKLKTLRFGVFNSFILPKEGDYSLKIYYTPQDYVNIGLVISGTSFLIFVSGLLFLIINKK